MEPEKETPPYETETYFVGDVKIEPTLQQVTTASGVCDSLSVRQIAALALLADNFGELVSREALHDVLHVGPVGTVVPNALTQHIRRIRAVLGDDASDPTFIKTVRGSHNRNYEVTKGSGYYLLKEPRFEAPQRWNQTPYLGLKAFEYDHAPIFFGRNRAISEIVAQLHDQAATGSAFVMVTGTSGIGKSSVVGAGVLPALCGASISGSKIWRHAVFRLGVGRGDPFVDLAETVVAAFPEILKRVGGVQQIARRLQNSPSAAANYLAKEICHALDRPAASQKAATEFRLALAVDQFEEFFTAQSITSEHLESFSLVLRSLARSGWCRIVATVRSDFLGQCLANKTLAKLISAGLYTLLPPAIAELRAIVDGPAHLRSLELEIDDVRGALTDHIVQDAAANPESLAILEFTLEQLYRCRDETGKLTFQNYDRLGGLQGCLAKRADEVLNSLPHEARSSLVSVLARLVKIDAKSKGTIVAKPALWKVVTATPASEQLVNAFRDERLFSVARARDGSRLVRVAHEAILTVWKVARDWVSENQYLLTIHAKLARHSEDWIRNDGAASLLLSTGLPLNEGVTLLNSQIQLSADERRYVEASLGAEQIRQRVIKSRLHKIRFAAASFAVVAVVATLLGVTALQQSRHALTQKEIAEDESKRANLSAEAANQSKDLLLRMFAIAGPSRSGGREVTVRDLLEEFTQTIRTNTTISLRTKAEALGTLGLAYNGLAEFDRAIDLLKESVAIYRELGPHDGPEFADALHRLGWVYIQTRDLDRGVPFVLSALTIYNDLGNKLRQASAHNSLGVASKMRGNFEGAERYYLLALKVKEDEFGSDHIETATIVGNLGQIYLEQKKLTAAERLLTDALATKEALLPANSPDLAYAYTTMAKLCDLMGDKRKAITYSEYAVANRRKALSRTHPDLAVSLNNLARLYTATGEFKKSLPLLENAIEIASVSKHVPLTHLAIYRSNYANSLVHAGSFERATEEIDAALELYGGTDAAPATRLATAKSIKGAALAGNHCNEISFQLMRDALIELSTIRGTSDPKTIEAAERLSTFCLGKARK